MYDYAQLSGALVRYRAAMVGSGAWACAAVRMMAENTRGAADPADDFVDEVTMWVYEEDYQVGRVGGVWVSCVSEGPGRLCERGCRVYVRGGPPEVTMVVYEEEHWPPLAWVDRGEHRRVHRGWVVRVRGKGPGSARCAWSCVRKAVPERAGCLQVGSSFPTCCVMPAVTLLPYSATGRRPGVARSTPVCPTVPTV